MLKKTALFIFTMVTLVSMAGYTVEESNDNTLACRDCKILASGEDNRPVHWIANGDDNRPIHWIAYGEDNRPIHWVACGEDNQPLHWTI